jgi:hypothetical protein
MQLSFAFLANVAEVLKDGRLLAIGIDFDTIFCGQFPIIAPVTLVVKINLDPSEISKSHTLAIEVTRPNGKRESLGPEQSFTIKANPIDASRPSGSAIIATIGFNFESAGEYLFHVLINGIEFKSLSLDVKQSDINIQTTG